MQTTSKFFSKRANIIAIFIIGITILVALFAYPLAKDKTPDANNLIIELGAKPIGFKKQFLMMPKPQAPANVSAWKAFWLGKPSPYIWLPINDYSQKGDSLIVTHYIDEEVSEILHFQLSKLYATTATTSIKKPIIHTQTFLLGTDRYGRDVYSRLLLGTRVSIAVGTISVILSLTLGILFGALAGWYGGWIDAIVMWFINLFWAIPTLLLVFAITLTIGKGFWEIFIAIGLTSWVSAARLIRGQVMQLKNMDFITAEKLIGVSDARIIIKHILPNISGPIFVIAAANFATAILVEAGLSFLGYGVQPPTPSWGLMIKEHYNYLVTDAPILALLPGMAIFTLVLAFHLLGNGLRDAFDVK